MRPTSLTGRPWRHGHCLRAPSDLPVHLPALQRPTCRGGPAAEQQRPAGFYRRGGAYDLRVRPHQKADDYQRDSPVRGRALFGVVSRPANAEELQSPSKSAERRFSPLAQEALSEVGCKKTSGEMVRIADSMPTRVAKGQRASQATVASDQLASVGYCSSKDTFFHGAGAPPFPGRPGAAVGSSHRRSRSEK